MVTRSLSELDFAAGDPGLDFANTIDWADDEHMPEYEALHAPDHRSRHASVNVTREASGPVEWRSAAEMTRNVVPILTGRPMVHHSYDPEIIFETPTKARGIWAMTDAAVSKNDDRDHWTIGYGYYYETYEKRDGRWLFTTRRWHNYFSTDADGVNFPKDAPKGSDAFDS